MEEFFAKDNQVISIVIVGVLLLLLMGAALLLFFFISRRKIIAKELEKKNLKIKHQEKIIESIIVTQEKERKRIAQDLHDDISSKLNVINLNANLLIDGELSVDEYTLVNRNILEVTDKTLESARKIAHNLLPPILEKFGLKEAIEELADSFSNSKKIHISYQINYPKAFLKANNELHIFRIAQELINNSVKHGKAQKATLQIKTENNKLYFNYQDNGLGFNTNTGLLKKGLGIKNIESRVALLKGFYHIKSAINQGFQISIIL